MSEDGVKKVLLRLFSPWVGSADNDEDVDRLEAVDLNNLDRSWIDLDSDILSRVSSEDEAKQIIEALNVVAKCKRSRKIAAIFDSYLVAVPPPADESKFAQALVQRLASKFK